MNHLLFIAVVVCGIAGAVTAKKLTLAAALTGGLLAMLIFIGVGWIGIALMGAFFLMGTLATSWQKNVKQSNGLSVPNETRRNTGQVLANGGAGGILGLLAIFFPEQASLYLYLLAASFSSATADTVSSELGNVYGKKFYDILTFKKGQRGLDGIISLEGTLFGLAGSCIIAAIYTASEGWNQTSIWIAVAGTAGNLADSFLGAALERKGIMKNDAVNFLNTAIATLVAYLLLKI